MMFPVCPLVHQLPTYLARISQSNHRDAGKFTYLDCSVKTFNLFKIWKFLWSEIKLLSQDIFLPLHSFSCKMVLLRDKHGTIRIFTNCLKTWGRLPKRVDRKVKSSKYQSCINFNPGSWKQMSVAHRPWEKSVFGRHLG